MERFLPVLFVKKVYIIDDNMFKKRYISLMVLIFIVFSTISAVSAATIEVEEDDSFYYYSENTPASQTGYSYAILIDGTPYYLTSAAESELCDFNTNFKSFFQQETSLNYGDSFKPDYTVSFGAYTGKVYEGTSYQSKDVVKDTEFENGEYFTIEYKIGKVGLNENANIVTKVIK